MKSNSSSNDCDLVVDALADDLVLHVQNISAVVTTHRARLKVEGTLLHCSAPILPASTLIMHYISTLADEDTL